MHQVIDAIIGTPTPIRAILQLVSTRNAPGRTPFERYAGIVLNDAGAEALSSWPLSKPVQLVPPGSGHMAQLVCSGSATEGERTILQDIEAALNRLISIVDTIEDSADFGQLQTGKLAIGHSPLGSGFLPDRPRYRSALVRLPAISPTEQPSLEYMNEVDWRVLDYIAGNAHAVFQSSMLPNLHQSFMGAHAPDHSDWDVRTRLASMLLKLELPLPFSCRFDCNVQAKAAAITFAVPQASVLPRYTNNGPNAPLEPINAKQAGAALAAYTMRLACLLGAACFGSGRRLDHAFIMAVREADSKPLLACRFDRDEYVRHTLTAINSGDLFDPALRFDAAAIAEIAKPQSFCLGDMDNIEAFQNERAAIMGGNRIEPYLDNRPLTDCMRRLFHARRICDIDTRHFFGSEPDEIREARNDSIDSTIAAIARLESIVAELESQTTPPDDDASARPLFCANPLSRATVSLLDDDYAVSLQAEAFLSGRLVEDIPADRIPCYFRAPNALFEAHLGLSELYERLGDYKGAEAQADICVALAPTTAQAHYRKASALAQQGKYEQAANIIVSGLRTAVSHRDCALLYYHLGLILSKIGLEQQAAAVFVYTTVFGGTYAEKAQHIIKSYRKREGAPIILSGSPLAASREMVRNRIPVAPSDEVRTLITKAAVGLSCANAPEAAAPYASALASYLRDDFVIALTAQSLMTGIEPARA